MTMTIKTNQVVPNLNAVACYYLNNLEGTKKPAWRTMDPIRMKDMFTHFLTSKDVSQETKKRILDVLKENF